MTGLSEKTQTQLLSTMNAICNDTASPAQLRELESLLLNDQPAQLFYAQYMQLHAELYWQQHASSPPTLPAGPSAALPPSTFPSLGSGTMFLGACLFATTMLALLALGAWAFYAVPHPDRGLAENSSHFLPAETRGPAVATISATRNCRWESRTGEPTNLAYGESIFEGQHLKLIEGFAEVTFNSGVRMILEGPSELDVSTVSQSVLHSGKLTASVPQGAEGFRIDMDGFTLVDLGTEFGVHTTDDGQAEVHVFDGLVEGFFHDTRATKVKWRTNETVRIDSKTKEIKAVFQIPQFVRSLSPVRGPMSGLFVEETFDYPAGRLGGLDGGFGWSGSWVDLSAAGGDPGTSKISPACLPFGLMRNAGNHVKLSGNFNRCRRTLETSFGEVFESAGFVEDQDGVRLIGRDGTALYLSFLQRVSEVNEGFYGFELNRGDGNSNRVLCVGRGAVREWLTGPPKSPNYAAGSTGWSVTSEYNGDSALRLKEYGSLGPETAEVVFIVMKIEFGENNQDVVEVFLNPNLNSSETKNTPIATGQGNFSFDRICLANFDGDKEFEIDHIRVGTSFDAVASYPLHRAESPAAAN